MAYDSSRGMVLLFGGADDSRVKADLWGWDGQRWRCLAGGGPPARTFPALGYDEARGRLILFGGNRVLFGTAADTATFLDDMWEWDGQHWSRVHTAVPPARAEPSMAYDSRRQRLVLFGGHRTVNGTRIRLGDTWEWDGARWEQTSTAGPPPRNGTAMAYDAHRGRVVLFGGNGPSGETWEWDGREWQRIESADTEGRFNSGLAFDASRRLIIRFGGWTGRERVGDTWSYNGTEWSSITDDGPAGRNHAGMAFDSRRGVIVLFGGHDGDFVFGDTWEWDGRAWSLRLPQTPRRRIDNGH